jgi:DNA repair exonuclease SbcCD ATPase subunit
MATNKQAAKRIEKDERARARAEIAATAAAYRAARAELVSHTRATNAERRARAQQTAEELRALRRRLRAIPRELLARLRATRDSYRSWWAEVQAERRRRLDEIASLRDHLAELRRATPQLVMAAVRRHKAEAEAEARSRASRAESRGASLSAAARKAKRLAAGTRGGHRKGSGLLARREPVSRAESARYRREASSEFWSLVEANLSPESAAYYRSHRLQFPGPSSGLPPDRVAELVDEALEAEPELSVENMQDRADLKVLEELKRMGYL